MVTKKRDHSSCRKTTKCTRSSVTVQKALDGKALMSIVAGVTVERLQNMIDGTPRILRLLPNTPAMVYVVL